MNKSESKYFNTAKKMDKALISLLEEKSFEYITVSEICKRAEVNRSTFYLHYETMDDLLSECIEYVGSKIRKKYSNKIIDKKIIKLAKELKKFGEENIELLKPYL